MFPQFTKTCGSGNTRHLVVFFNLIWCMLKETPLNLKYIIICFTSRNEPHVFKWNSVPNKREYKNILN